MQAELSRAPTVRLDIYDTSGGVLGTVRLSPCACVIMKEADLDGQITPLCPKWLPLNNANPDAQDVCGEVLVASELILKEAISSRLPDPASISPRMRRASIEVTVLGLRDMAPFVRAFAFDKLE